MLSVLRLIGVSRKKESSTKKLHVGNFVVPAPDLVAFSLLLRQFQSYNFSFNFSHSALIIAPIYKSVVFPRRTTYKPILVDM